MRPSWTWRCKPGLSAGYHSFWCMVKSSERCWTNMASSGQSTWQMAFVEHRLPCAMLAPCTFLADSTHVREHSPVSTSESVHSGEGSAIENVHLKMWPSESKSSFQVVPASFHSEDLSRGTYYHYSWYRVSAGWWALCPGPPQPPPTVALFLMPGPNPDLLRLCPFLWVLNALGPGIVSAPEQHKGWTSLRLPVQLLGLKPFHTWQITTLSSYH